ncbi:hypothetical protein PF005_g26869 [Phytophthora fragariae]|uniref:Uncharacterized protein n=1 Tax=Phytophthora fragariae TaxID=53985 RepID=A0A6A3FP50_9STRA|nr:hypothetical protein PF009_g3366 [Phytophthora fragariae]KAE9127986.1 hypothetical protein PF007_g5412 [Phytophthora fragariae]KAE9172088.1 hypothetical protein PF005_g26869 [Phytophthora fragariae]KAE9247144.1 hypothetical protein PF004_g4446 [Phytophthora fragariae]KAE9255067.1 hypothetical protein PF002_g2532 [Phytophthora fragariae]
MAPTISFTNKQVCDFFFKPVLDYYDEPTGYTNLISHVRAKHLNFAAEMASSGLNSGTLVGFVDKKS